MKINKVTDLIYILLVSAMLAIGRVYDSRLEVFDFNFSYFFSIPFILLSILFLSSKIKIYFNDSNKNLIFFYLSVIIITPLLWLVYGTFETDIGTYSGSIDNFINFCFITVLLSLVILKNFKFDDVKKLFLVLFLVGLFLSLTSLLSLSELKNGRFEVLGGGPIVFCRWMLISILILFTFPHKRFTILKFLLSLFFFTLALASGSRGPLIAFLITVLVYLLLNFKKIFFYFILIISFLFIYSNTTDLKKMVYNFGNSKRVFMNFSQHGIKSKSTLSRVDLTKRGFEMIYHYPLGVGMGNWQVYSNKIKPYHLVNAKHFYPHNLFLEIFNEYGFISFILFLFLMIKAFKISFIKMNEHQQHLSMYPMLFYLLIFLFLNSLLSGSLNDSRIMFTIISLLFIQTPLIKKC